MVTTRGIKAGAAFVELSAVDSKLVKGLRRAERQVKAFGKRIASVGAQVTAVSTALAAPFIAATKIFADTGDQLNKMSARTGVAVESLSRLGFAAEQSGAGIEALESGLRRMQSSINDAGRGLSTATDALDDLGLSFESLSGQSPEDQFRLIAQRISDIEDPTKRAAVAMQLFGRSGQRLIPLLGNIEALTEQADKLGITLSTAEADAAAEFTDQMNILNRVIRRSAQIVGGALVPTVRSVIERFTAGVVVINDWIKANKELVVTAARTVLVFGAVGVAVTAAGVAIIAVGATLGSLATIITTVGSGLVVITAGFTAIVSPIGLAVGAVAAATAVLLKFTGAGEAVVSFLGARFMQLSAFVTESFSGIRDALASGDITLAANILWLSLKVAFQTGLNELATIWINLKTGFLQTIDETVIGAIAGFTVLWNKIKEGWANVVNFVEKLIQSSVSVITDTFARIQAVIDDGLASAAEFFGVIDAGTADRARQATARRLEETLGRSQQQLIQGATQSDADRDAAIQDAREATAAALREAVGQLERINDQTEADRQQAIEDNNTKLDALRSKLQESIDQASEQQRELGAGGLLDFQSTVEQIRNAFEGLDTSLSTTSSRLASVGSFSARAIQGLAFGSFDQNIARTANATERTARSIERLERQAEDSGLAFT